MTKRSCHSEKSLKALIITRMIRTIRFALILWLVSIVVAQYPMGVELHLDLVFTVKTLRFYNRAYAQLCYISLGNSVYIAP